MENINLKDWEVKDRTYQLNNGMTPLTYKIRSIGILWFDEEKKTNREIRYAPNQQSLFRDEQDEHARISQIVFEDGYLNVSRRNVLLQQLMSFYHPEAGTTWVELDPQKEAADDVDMLDREFEALEMLNSMEVDHLEAVMRAEMGSKVATLTSKELKRDAYALAKTNPALFMDLVNDEDLKLRSTANKAVERGILKLTDDGTTFRWNDAKKRVVFTVPFGENAYKSLGQHFLTDEGTDLYKQLLKKLK